MTRKIAIFDTTLRDGEQSPGASMNTEEKLVIARQLLRLNVDVIEAGFPISSPGDFESVRRIAELAGDQATVCALTRAVEKDIDSAADALKYAKRPRIHTGIGVSPSHMRDKLRITEEECIERAVKCVSYAKKFVDDVQFYAEDAGRSDFAFLARVIEAVIAAGATVVNIPDTTGYSLPEDFGARIKYLMDNVKGIDDVTVSVHCHNDLGMATALSLAGVRNGATQIECTINGLGERAGNTAMEEVVMAMRMHGEELDAHTDINTREFIKAIPGVEYEDMRHNRADSLCCGLVNAFYEIGSVPTSGVARVSEADEVGADYILTACAGCGVQVNNMCVAAQTHARQMDITDLAAQSLGFEVYDSNEAAQAYFAAAVDLLSTSTTVQDQ